ncbi:hypothetical protein NQ040_04825 [Staphylococcus cohnii]|uniref:hypothetical protein n=1 Tax=Staphylococcus TaxID=1279 RepID=UPI000D1C6B75|nr:hypothetical protein [Staphylococcus sp. GDY8P196P]MCQ9293249.1 hypothetical protein [Staphylococcus cohnii]PTF40075.1 hypothetical protein BUY29_10085 [Staphylococcus cohnii]RIM43678.1 hypothetical protein BUY22_11505 [Staphylococcus cohnii]
MGINTTRWKDKENENFNKVIELLVNEEENSFNTNDETKVHYKNIVINKHSLENNIYKKESESIEFEKVDFNFTKVRPTAALINEKSESIISGYIVAYEKKSVIYYIISRHSDSKNILRNILNYTGNKEIVDNKIAVESDFIIWLIYKFYNSLNVYSINEDNQEEQTLKIESIIGFKGDAEDEISRITTDGDTVMNLISSIAFLLESRKLTSIKLKVRFNNHQKLVFKLHINGSINIDMDEYNGDFRNLEENERTAKILLLIYLEIMPLLSEWYEEDKSNNNWGNGVYNQFLDKLITDIEEKVNQKKSQNGDT